MTSIFNSWQSQGSTSTIFLTQHCYSYHIFNSWMINGPTSHTPYVHFVFLQKSTDWPYPFIIVFLRLFADRPSPPQHSPSAWSPARPGSPNASVAHWGGLRSSCSWPHDCLVRIIGRTPAKMASGCGVPKKWRDDDGVSVVLSHPFARCLGLPRNHWNQGM
jgi:hypothetical protein